MPGIPWGTMPGIPSVDWDDVQNDNSNTGPAAWVTNGDSAPWGVAARAGQVTSAGPSAGPEGHVVPAAHASSAGPGGYVQVQPPREVPDGIPLPPPDGIPLPPPKAKVRRHRWENKECEVLVQRLLAAGPVTTAPQKWADMASYLPRRCVCIIYPALCCSQC
jgi:hypothetical protein